MEFVLYYRGALKANGRSTEKHKLRKHFHAQLSLLWQQKPLNGYADRLLKNHEDLEPREFSILERV